MVKEWTPCADTDIHTAIRQASHPTPDLRKAIHIHSAQDKQVALRHTRRYQSYRNSHQELGDMATHM